MPEGGLRDTARNRTIAASRRWAVLFGFLAYLGIAVVMYWHVLTSSYSRATTCACSDTSLFVWFFEWPLVALRHGTNPFFSSAMFHPQGINLLSNTSVTAWSFLLLPVTWAFGPVASLNTALVLAPAAGGASAMWVAQRWVRSSAAACLAGALYAFSPLVLFQAAGAHLMITSLVVPPLVVACLDELFWRRRHPPIKVGIALALLVCLQFFSGTELLVMLAVAVLFGLLVLGVAALVADRAACVAAVKAGMPGLVVAVVASVVLLAWPTYYALFGPGHYVGPVWPGIAPPQASLRSYLQAIPGTVLWWVPEWGRFMRPTYLGPALVLTMAAGLVLCRRDLRLRAAVAMTALVAWLALGQRYAFAAWHYLSHAPVLRDVMNERFSALLFLPAGLALALVLDDVRRWRRGIVGVALAFAIAVACVAPFVRNASNGLPYAASTIWEPAWYQRNADALPPGEVILGLPYFTTSADLLAVQALHHMRYSIVGGTGPEWIDARQGPAEPGYRVLKQVASRWLRPSLGAPSAAQAAAFKAALDHWGTTLIVVPADYGFNTSPAARPPREVVAWLTAVLGGPRVQDGAWVWRLRPGALAASGGTGSSS